MIVYGLDKVKDLPEGEVHFTIGTFDGVHLGHQELIDSAIKAAKQSNGISVVLTFWPHPSRFFRPENPVPTIMSAEIKSHFLEERGVDLVIQQVFTDDFAQTSAEDFVGLLKRQLPGLKSIYVGGDFRFGYKREGNVDFLIRTGKYLGFNVIRKKSILYRDARISSSRIRQSLLEGRIEEANAMLGYPYFSVGMVVDSEKKEKYPTLDIIWQPELQPQYGVYAVNVTCGKNGQRIEGVANYGLKPTLSDVLDPTLEVYLFEPTEWGPGDLLTVEWLRFIRGEQKFESKEAFKDQIIKDIEEAKAALRGLS